jgi:hypothetical protein
MTDRRPATTIRRGSLVLLPFLRETVDAELD